MHPGHDRVAVEHPPPLVAPHQRQTLLHLLAGPREGGVELVGGAPVLLAGEGLGGLEDGDLVEHLSASQRVLDEVAARADVEHDVGPGDGLPGGLDRHGAPVGDVGAVDRLVVDEEPARDRVQPVRGHDDGRLLDVPVLEGDRGPALGVLEPDGPPVVDELDPGATAGPEEDAVQVAAVDHHVRVAVATLEVEQVESGQLGTVDGVLHDHALGQDAELLRLLEEPVLVEDARAVGGDLHPRTDLPELPGTLEDADVQPGAAQGVGGAEPADATADDDDVGGRCGGAGSRGHGSLLERRGRGSEPGREGGHQGGSGRGLAGRTASAPDRRGRTRRRRAFHAPR